jgi:enoyl-CoA hydratase/carnithine racemase
MVDASTSFNYTFINAEKKGSVLELWLNRPQVRNAMHEPMEIELFDALDKADDDPDIKVVTLRGKGELFSAGHDLKEAAERYARTGRAAGGIPRPRAPALNRAWYCRKTLIAGVHGYVGPATWFLLDAFDFVIAAENTRFSREQARMGSGAAGGYLTPFLLPMRVINQLWLLGGWMDAQTARELHYVQRVVPLENLGAEVDRWAQVACALSTAQIAAHKESIHRHYEIMGLAGIANIENQVPANVRPVGESLVFYELVRKLGMREALSYRQEGIDSTVTKV